MPVDKPLTQFISDTFFLALTMWREARGESYTGRLAIAFCVMNRVLRPSWWGDSVQSVVTKKMQFSSITAPGDSQLVMWPKEDDKVWQECLQIALDVQNHVVGNPVPGADSYYAVSIPAPKWATEDYFVRQIGQHRFFNLDRDVEAAAV